MKYQIYLDKETSEYVEDTAKKANLKSNTLIKILFESIVKMVMQSQEISDEALEKAVKSKNER